MNAEIKSISGSDMSEYMIRADRLHKIYRAMNAIFDEYPPEGYGTRCHGISRGYDGMWEARISRANSSD